MNEKKRKKGSTSGEEMFAAVNLVLTDGLSINEVSRRTGIGKTTLQRYVTKKKNCKNNCDISYTPNYDVKKVFSTKDEFILAEYLKQCDSMNFELNGIGMRKMAFQFAKINKIIMPPSWKIHKMAGSEWLRLFLKRQHLNIKKLPKINSTSQKMTPFNNRNIKKFYDNLMETLINYSTINESEGEKILNFNNKTNSSASNYEQSVKEDLNIVKVEIPNEWDLLLEVTKDSSASVDSNEQIKNEDINIWNENIEVKIENSFQLEEKNDDDLEKKKEFALSMVNSLLETFDELPIDSIDSLMSEEIEEKLNVLVDKLKFLFIKNNTTRKNKSLQR